MTDALLRVSTGFKLVFYGLLLIVLGVVLGFVGICVLAGAAGAAGNNRGAAQGVPAGVVAVTLGMGGMMVVGSILGLIGRVFCLSIPEEAGAAKGMILASVGLEVVSLGFTVVNAADGAGGNFIPPEAKLAGSGGTALASIAAAVLFLLFTRSAALYVRKPALAAKAMSVLWLSVGTFVCYLAGIVVIIAGIVAVFQQGGQRGANPGAAAGAGVCGGSLLMLVALVLFVVTLILYAILLTGMADAVRRFADRGDFGDYDDDYDDEDDRPRRRRRRQRDEYEDEDDEEDDDRGRRRYRDWD